MPSYIFKGYLDGENKTLKLVVLNESTQAEHPEYGEVVIALDDVLAAVTSGVTAIESGATLDDCRTIKLRETPICMDDGTTGYCMILRGAIYSKP